MPAPFLLKRRQFCDNCWRKGEGTVYEIVSTLEMMGLPKEECWRIMDVYRNDIDGLTMYALHIKAMFGDAHEYID